MQQDTNMRSDETELGEGPKRRVVVANQLGLHARPAGALAKQAQMFSADIAIVVDDQEVDAKSILDILTLAASQGTTLELKADGDDAEAALNSLEELFKNRFGEEK